MKFTAPLALLPQPIFFVYPPKAQTASSPENGGKTLWNFGESELGGSIHFQVNHVEFRGCFFIYMSFFDCFLRIQLPKGPTKCFFFQGSEIGRIFLPFLFIQTVSFLGIVSVCLLICRIDRCKYINIASIMCVSMMIDNVKLDENANRVYTLYMRM